MHDYSLETFYFRIPYLNRLVGCFWLNGSLRQYLSLYRALRNKIRRAKETSKQPQRVAGWVVVTFCLPSLIFFLFLPFSGRLGVCLMHDYSLDTFYFRIPYFNRLVGCFWLNGPLRQYLSLYRALRNKIRRAKETSKQPKRVAGWVVVTFCLPSLIFSYFSLSQGDGPL